MAGVVAVRWRSVVPDFAAIETSVLPFGQGRSYGDSCLNAGGVLLDTASLSRFMAFDSSSGVLRCESGVTLASILEFCVPRGWFLAVTPGTKYISVGGAIAHDVHGKNHHRHGTFGVDVLRFELLRSSGERIECSRVDHPDLFAATIGGMGLTGLILWAEIQLKPITGPMIDAERIRVSSLDEFFDVSAASEAEFEYTVAWVDCLARGRALGRGIFFRGNHAVSPAPAETRSRPARGLRVPFDVPEFMLNRWTVWLGNTLNYHRQFGRTARSRVHYDPFFYPLDSLRDWNRLYGRRGFLQYQCVVPHSDRRAIKQILERIASSGSGSFLGVLKTFGSAVSPGLLSFPRPGVTLSLDFPFRGERTLALFHELDDVVRSNGGAVYPAKDACMSARNYQAYFPQWREFERYVDPKFSSSFWRRVSAVP